MCKIACRSLCGDVDACGSLCGDVIVGGHPVAEIPSADIVDPIFADEQVSRIAPFGQRLPSYMELPSRLIACAIRAGAALLHGAWSTEHGARSMEHSTRSGTPKLNSRDEKMLIWAD